MSADLSVLIDRKPDMTASPPCADRTQTKQARITGDDAAKHAQPKAEAAAPARAAKAPTKKPDMTTVRNPDGPTPPRVPIPGRADPKRRRLCTSVWRAPSDQGAEPWEGPTRGGASSAPSMQARPIPAPFRSLAAERHHRVEPGRRARRQEAEGDPDQGRGQEGRHDGRGRKAQLHVG